MKSLKPVHPFPARMAASIAFGELQSERKPLRVLDPMAGSGTTLAVGKLYGHEVIGFDIDPLSVVLAKAWCTQFAPDRFRSAARRALKSARAAEQRMKLRAAYPCARGDSDTRRYTRYWFNPYNRRQLTCLSRSISREEDADMRNLMWCAFSRLIVRKDASVSLARDVSHGKPHRVRSVSDVLPLEEYTNCVEAIIRASPLPQTGICGAASVHHGDARCLPLESESIDVVITSPPYLNAIEYLRGHKLVLIWMGYSIRDVYSLKRQSIGTDACGDVGQRQAETVVIKGMVNGHLANLKDRQRRILERYIVDLDAVVAEIARVLKFGSCATFVVGNSTIGKVLVRNSFAICRIARKHGLTPVSRYSRVLPDNRRYLPPPSRRMSKLDTRIREEVVLKFQKLSRA